MIQATGLQHSTWPTKMLGLRKAGGQMPGASRQIWLPLSLEFISIPESTPASPWVSPGGRGAHSKGPWSCSVEGAPAPDMHACAAPGSKDQSPGLVQLMHGRGNKANSGSMLGLYVAQASSCPCCQGQTVQNSLGEQCPWSIPRRTAGVTVQSVGVMLDHTAPHLLPWGPALGCWKPARPCPPGPVPSRAGGCGCHCVRGELTGPARRPALACLPLVNHCSNAREAAEEDVTGQGRLYQVSAKLRQQAPGQSDSPGPHREYPVVGLGAAPLHSLAGSLIDWRAGLP